MVAQNTADGRDSAEAVSFSQRYKSRWDGAATVRCGPRPLPDLANESGDYFPELRQPLAMHPDVAALGPNARRFALVQSAYKYMNDVALTETEVVSRTATAIANGRVAANLPQDFRQIALTVVVDEAYHALVARDFIAAVEAATAIASLPLPDCTELSQAIELAHAKLAPAMHDDFDVMALCIAENTLTKEIVDLSCAGSELAKSFSQVLKDHLADEVRHAAFFQRVLAQHWQDLPTDRRDALAAVLPDFLLRYLNVETQRGFDASILAALEVAPAAAATIVEDLHGGFALGPRHPMLRAIVAMLDRVGILAYGPVRTALGDRGLIA